MKNPHKRGLIVSLCIATGILFSGCISQTPVISGTPTPSSSPTPLPELFTAKIQTTPIPTDAAGRRISESQDNHYFQYLSFGDFTVYEYNMSTHLDGICINAYTQPLKGSLNVVYYDKQHKLCGSGAIKLADGTLELKPGQNHIYAEILTDTNITEMDFKLEITEPFIPAE